MPRPTNKTELLNLGQKNYDDLNSFIDKLEDVNKEFSKGTMNRNVRDVLAHLHHWHLMVIEWYTIGMRGEKPEIPGKEYTWKTLPELNKKIWEDHKSKDVKTVRKLFVQSYNEIRKLIEKHTNDELFEKKRYKWTGTTSMGAYFVSVTSSHYDWALKLIKKGLK